MRSLCAALAQPFAASAQPLRNLSSCYDSLQMLGAKPILFRVSVRLERTIRIAPPTKRQRQLNQLCELHRSRRALLQLDVESDDKAPSDDKICPDFFFAEIPENNLETIDQRICNLIKWNQEVASI